MISGKEEPFSSFEEGETVKFLLESEVIHGESKSIERIRLILDKYQEEPSLLDRHLPSLVDPLCSHWTHASALGVLYLLCKVRGAKTMVRLFPLDAALVDPLISLLQVLNLILILPCCPEHALIPLPDLDDILLPIE